ncbi:choline BCCT transporter BetT [Corynebacterium glucuronolyticum]
MPQESEDAYRPQPIVGTYNVDDPSTYGHHTSAPPRVNRPVLGFSVLGILVLTAWAFFARESAATTLAAVTGWISVNLGWFYILTATAAVVFVLFVAIGKTGSIRLGPDHSRPQFGIFSWSAMLFAAGIGVDLMFFSVAEPVTMYFNPPQGGGETRQAAEDAVVFAMFHYGVTGWALYALMGMAFGYFAYRLNMPLAIRSALYPLIGKRIHGPIGDSVDIAATLGTTFGIAASLGIGVVQLNYGLKLMFGLSEGPGAQAILVVLAVGIATLSAVSGVDKGIKRLSEANVLLAIGLMVYVVIAGKTAFLFDAIIMNIGDYVSKFASWTMDTYAFSETPAATQEWLQSWTLFFWAWWVAWAPFVGLFLARISRGRTLRQFVAGTLTIPFLFILLWMSFFGNSALDRILGGDAEFGAVAMNEPQRGFYELIASYPGGTILVFLTTIIGLLLYITSADSGALVLSNFTARITDSQQDGATWSRVVWSVIIGALTLVMLQIDGVATVQSATIVMGLPFTVVIYMIMASLVKSLQLETYQDKSRIIALHGAMSGRTGTQSWRTRLRRAVTYPATDKVVAYMEHTAQPALEKVAHELEKAGLNVTLLRSVVPDCPVPQLDLGIALGEEKDFRFQVYPVKSDMPSFGSRRAGTPDTYYRLEVFDLSGSLGYDVFGYPEEALIDNVLDLVERHFEFIHMQGDLSGSSDLSDGAEPYRTWTEEE